jgi:hypothetical protein
MDADTAPQIKIRQLPEGKHLFSVVVTDQERDYLLDLARELNCLGGDGQPTHDFYAWLGEMARRLREARDAVIQRTAVALGPHEEADNAQQ